MPSHNQLFYTVPKSADNLVVGFKLVTLHCEGQKLTESLVPFLLYRFTKCAF